jgi:hypothetical protein
MKNAILCLCAPNDTNGNPRRVYVAHDCGGFFIGAWDDAYTGVDCVPADIRANSGYTVYVETTPKEYKAWLLRGATLVASANYTDERQSAS